MKHGDLIRTITRNGAELTRRGAKHDWYTNHATKISIAVPRHSEVNENTARKIIKKLAP
jgi:predicted RNA binding protein YcfA (HicA-like mRNA interferase family)